MKKNIAVFAFISVWMVLSSSASILTVSNYVGVPAQYTDIGAAIGAAAVDDTIYVHGSPNAYPQTWITKRVVLIGAGYNPKTDFPHFSFVTEFDNTVGGNGSTIVGFRITTVQNPGGASSDTLKNYTYRNCWILNGSFSISKNYENFLIENCIFQNMFNNLSNNWPNNYQTGLIIRNCIFSDSFVQLKASTVVDHCIFIGSNTSLTPFINCSNSTFSNNIFVARTINASDATNCIFNNNLTFNCTNNTLPIGANFGTGNISNQNPQFVNYPVTPPVTFSFTHNLRLQNTSPGYNASTDGTDLGVYGANHKFSMTGESPNIPVMRKLDIYNTTVPFNGTLNVNFKSSVPVTD